MFSCPSDAAYSPRQQEILDGPHGVEVCYDTGEGWTLICECQWEAWGQGTEARARGLHAAHVLDPLADKPVTVTA